MSQSAPWNPQPDFSQGQGGGVAFYDPTKFQAANQNPQVQSHSAANSFQGQSANGQYTQAGASNSWNSWDNTSWGDNSSTTSSQGHSLSNDPSPQKGAGDHVHHQPVASQPGQEQQYYNQWNQGSWDVTGQQQQQSWQPGGDPQLDWQQSQQVWENQQQWQPQQLENSYGNQGQQPLQQHPQQQQQHPHQQHPHLQHPQQQHPQHPEVVNSQLNQVPPVSGPTGEYQTSLSNSNTSGQFYGQFTPDTSGNFSQSSASYLSQSGGLNDSTSSSLDQSGSSQQTDQSGTSQSESSAQVADDSMNSEGGTVSGFFGKDDDESAIDGAADVKVVGNPQTQFLQVNQGFHRTESGISNASLQTIGSSSSMEEMYGKEQLQQVTQQFQNVSLTEPSPAGTAYPAADMNQNAAGGVPRPQHGGSQHDDDQQTSIMNDWEIVPDQLAQDNSGVNFFIGSAQQNVGESFPGMPADRSGNLPPGGEIQPQTQTVAPRVSGPPPPMAGTGHQLDTPPRPPQAGSPAANPFRKASPRNLQWNSSNQSLPSIQGEPPATGSPVIFSPQAPFPTQPFAGQPDLGNSFSTSNVSSPQEVGDIPKPSPSDIVSSDASSFKPPVPTVDRSKGQIVPSAGLLPNKMKPDLNVGKEVAASQSTAANSDPTKANDLAKVQGSSKPTDTSPGKPGSKSNPASPRRHASAFHPVSHRAKHSMSPAATLWDNLDTPATNIILAPAAPLLSSAASSSQVSGVKSPPLPVIPIQASLESKLKGKDEKEKVSQSKENVLENRGSGKESKSFDGMKTADAGGGKRRDEDFKRKEEDNRSINSLDELDAQIDYRDDYYDYRERRYKERYGNRERPSSRNDSYREDGRRRDANKGRDYRDGYSRDGYYDERYDRPRSRGMDDERMAPKAVRDGERPRSRAEYEREQYYRERDRYNRQSSYDYDYYGRRSQYYDDRYYQYYQRDPRDARYSRGYYDEYYGQDPQAYGHSGDYYHGNGSRSSSRQGQEEVAGYSKRGAYEYDNYGYDNYAYYQEYYQQYGYDYRDGHYQQGDSQSRLTPQKHTIPHVRATFGPNGQLIKVLPNRPADGQPAMVEIHQLEETLSDNTVAEELKTFPGPLTRVDTHKNDVLQFCQRRAQSCSDNISMVDRESAMLIWKLLELLIKQNGSVVGTDIADLLLDGHEPTSHEYSMMGMKITQSTEELDKIDEDEGSEGKVTSDRSQVNRGQALEEITDRFRHLLLYGRKKDALEWATKNNLWGHALFLASKMDTRTHANVMIRFANSAMKMNDPLQTLYQLMSGRQPAAVTCVVDERWGDWRPHLAMVLSNNSNKPELDRKSIATLGDTMAAKGCLHASHFCYLMAQSGFGTYNKKTSKLVLIGASHNLPWEEFATNEAIQCTEIYEYAQSLGNQAFILPNFQVYKFLYASRLAEYGFPQEALHYCEVIANTIQQSPAWFQPSFVKVLHELSDRLKFYDPQRVHEGDDMDDPAWLQQLKRVCLGYDDGSIQPVSGNATPALYGGTTASSESGDVNYPGAGEYSAGQYQGYGQGQGFQETSSYQQNYAQETAYQQQQYQQYGDTNAQTDGQTASTENQMSLGKQNEAATSQWQNQYAYNYSQPVVPQQEQTDPPGQTTGYNAPAVDNQTSASAGVGQTSSQLYNTQSYHQQYNYSQQPMGQDFGETGRLQSQRGSIASSTHSMEAESEQTDGGQELPAVPQSSFDYFSAATQTKIVAPPSRYRSTSGSSSTGEPPRGRQRTLSESSTGSVKAAPSMKKSHTDGSVTSKAKDAKSLDNKGKKSGGGGGGGWLSSVFKWGKSKNEMHLPKDDKQSIVWDPVKKKWMNMDGEEEDEKSAMPPPKDADLMGNSTAPVPAAVPTAMGAMPPTGNRFSRPKGRADFGARNQYVDVMGNKSTPAPTIPSTLFNVLPSATPTASSNAQIFNPSGNVSSEPSSQQPAVPSGGETTGNLLEPPSGEPEPVPAPVTNPIMFNPAQFQASQPLTHQPAAGSGPKYGARRQYPKK